MSDARDAPDARDEGEASAPSTPSRPPPGSVLAVRLGHGANCSSLGSVVDTLFLTATVGAAVFAAVVAALGREPVRSVGKRAVRVDPSGTGAAGGLDPEAAPGAGPGVGPAGPAPAPPRGER